MNIAFTICSNNYLAYAKTVGDSFSKYHPEFTFYIALVDKLSSSISKGYLENFQIVPVEQLNIKNFESLQEKYNITELNTAVKPSYFTYFFKEYAAEKIIYLDPDILVTGRFDEVIEQLKTANIILTPHITSPVDDEYTPTDYHTLRGGIFNLGFIALSEYKSIKIFLNWWHERVIKYGYGNYTLNMFYDQLWANYIPCFYNNYFILKHPGYNAASWNLHERFLSCNNDEEYLVNDIYPLKFFHFSGYKFNKPDIISTHLSRFNFKQKPELKSFFDKYNQLLHNNGIEEISQLPVFYYPELQKEKKHKHSAISGLKWRLSRSLQLLINGQ